MPPQAGASAFFDRLHFCADARWPGRSSRLDAEERMAPDDRAFDVEPQHPDGLTPAQLRRFELWRAMSALAHAQADGKLTAEQARLLESLADNLQQLAGQLSQLAELGQQCVQLIDAGRAAPGPAAD